MNDFIKACYDARINLLRTWRARYAPSEYPRKTILNLLYETLTTEKMWSELLQYFNTMDYSGNRQAYQSFSEAHEFVFLRRRQVQVNDVRPILDHQYNSRSQVGNLKIDGIRQRVTGAEKGDNKQVEELEFTYVYYTLAHEMIYAWAACGLLGLSCEEAYQEAADLMFEGIDYSSFVSVEAAFGKNAGFYLNSPLLGGGRYKPQPALWK